MPRFGFARVVAALVAVVMMIGVAPAHAQDARTLRALTSSEGIADTRAPEGGARVVVFGDSHSSGTNAPFTSDERGCLKGARS